MNSICPKSIKEIQPALVEMTENSKILGGGTDLIINIKNGKTEVDTLCYLGHIDELKKIELDGDKLTIGAYATMTDIENNEDIRKYFPALPDAVSDVGSLQIRNNGTIGGNIGNASPAADSSPVLYLYDAKVEVAGPEGIRTVPIDEIILGSEKTSLAYNEVITRFHLPLPDFKSAYIKLGSRAKVTISRIGLALGLKMDGDMISEMILYAGAITQKPVKCEDAENFLKGKTVSDEILIEASKMISALMLPDRYYKRYAVRGVLLDVFERIAKR